MRAAQSMSAESVLCTGYSVSFPLILCALIVSVVMMTSCMVMLLVSVVMMPLKGTALALYFDLSICFGFGSAMTDSEWHHGVQSFGMWVLNQQNRTPLKGRDDDACRWKQVPGLLCSPDIG